MSRLVQIRSDLAELIGVWGWVEAVPFAEDIDADGRDPFQEIEVELPYRCHHSVLSLVLHQNSG
jgi:hypothetical protein